MRQEGTQISKVIEVIKMKQELKEIKEKISALKQTQGWDARKKAYRDGEKEIGKLVNQGKMITVELAIKRIKTLGHDFKAVNEKYRGPIGIYERGKEFVLYIKPYFSEYRDSDMSFGIYGGLGNYARSLLSSDDKHFNINIGGVIDGQYKKHLAAKKITNKNNANANELYLLLKNVLSYKSYSSIFECDKTPWMGDKIQVEYIDREELWHDKAQVEYEFRNKHFEVRATMNFTLLTADDCHSFWGEFDRLVKKYTDFIRKKENE